MFDQIINFPMYAFEPFLILSKVASTTNCDSFEKVMRLEAFHENYEIGIGLKQ